MEAQAASKGADALYELLMEKSPQKPLLFKNFLRKSHLSGVRGKPWECVDWKLEDWSKALKDDPMKIRLGKLQSDSNEPQWESTCLVSYLKFDDLVKWSFGETSCLTTSGNITSKTHWAYYDYIYMSSLIHVDFLKQQVAWDQFGFTGRNADKSTLWIGTTGSHTPCHIDTYGCNLVAQVYGKKRWLLFPPSQTDFMYPTRVPYEESSIYSEVDFTDIDIKKFPKLKNTTPYVVTLEPGDVLFVPKHWWHFVENISFAISINTWIELPSDSDDRLKESLVEYQVGNICQGTEYAFEITSLLNSNMIDIAAMDSTEINQNVIKRLRAYLNKSLKSENETEELMERQIKKRKVDQEQEDESSKDVLSSYYQSLGVTQVASKTFEQHFGRSGDTSAADGHVNSLSTTESNQHSDKSEDKDLRRILAQSLTHPKVIDTLFSVLKEKIKDLEETGPQT